MDNKNNPLVLYHGTDRVFKTKEIMEGMGFLRKGIYTHHIKKVASVYGKHICRITIPANSDTLDLRDGQELLNWMFLNGILECDDIDIDTENYIISGRSFQMDPWNREGLMDDVMATAVFLGFDVVEIADDLGQETADSYTTVILNRDIIQ